MSGQFEWEDLKNFLNSLNMQNIDLTNHFKHPKEFTKL